MIASRSDEVASRDPLPWKTVPGASRRVASQRTETMESGTREPRVLLSTTGEHSHRFRILLLLLRVPFRTLGLVPATLYAEGTRTKRPRKGEKEKVPRRNAEL